MSRPVDSWDYNGECPSCFAGEAHSLDEHDAALVFDESAPVIATICWNDPLVDAVAFQAGITREQAAAIVDGEALS